MAHVSLNFSMATARSIIGKSAIPALFQALY
ncbi:hypothetical protein P3T21_005600 [Paraburkholderia sp. GAS334]